LSSKNEKKSFKYSKIKGYAKIFCEFLQGYPLRLGHVSKYFYNIEIFL